MLLRYVAHFNDFLHNKLSYSFGNIFFSFINVALKTIEYVNLLLGYIDNIDDNMVELLEYIIVITRFINTIGVVEKHAILIY